MPKINRRSFAEVWGDLAKMQTKDLRDYYDMLGTELGTRSKPKEKKVAPKKTKEAPQP